MIKKRLSIVEQEIIAVPEFAKVEKKLYQQVILRGQSSSTLNKVRSKNSKVQGAIKIKTGVYYCK